MFIDLVHAFYKERDALDRSESVLWCNCFLEQSILFLSTSCTEPSGPQLPQASILFSKLETKKI